MRKRGVTAYYRRIMNICIYEYRQYFGLAYSLAWRLPFYFLNIYIQNRIC